MKNKIVHAHASEVENAEVSLHLNKTQAELVLGAVSAVRPWTTTAEPIFKALEEALAKLR